MYLECHPLIMQDSQKMYSPRNWKITTYCECLTKHGKTRHNCTEGKHVIDILRQWKAGYQMLDLTLWVSGLTFLWWPSADGTNPVGMDHAGVQDKKKKKQSFLWCRLSSTMNCEDTEVELLTHKKAGSRIPRLTFMRTTQTFFIVSL